MNAGLQRKGPAVKGSDPGPLKRPGRRITPDRAPAQGGKRETFTVRSL